MRVLLTGAGGLIGSAVLHALVGAGHEVVALHRRRPGPALPGVVWHRLDLRDATRPEVWTPHLAGVDAAVNCAGVFQDGPGDATAAVHAHALAALVQACGKAGVRRLVQVSAIGVDRDPPTAFSRSKAVGDAAVAASGLDWVILRPSVVLGPAAYGGSALFRGLAALPLLPVPPDTGPLQVVQLDDVVRSILYFLQPDAPARQAYELAGPERLGFAEIIRGYRRWLGWPPAREIRLPAWLAGPMFRAGDLVSLLGWRPPMRSTARHEMTRGAVGDPAPWQKATGIRPLSFRSALAARPASVQERWFARSYFLKPLAQGVFALFWIATGLVSLGPGWEVGVGLMERVGAGALAAPSVVGGALADIVIGTGLLFRRSARRALWAAFALSWFYVIVGSILAPFLWADPLGPMLKIWPIMGLNLLLLAILDDR